MSKWILAVFFSSAALAGGYQPSTSPAPTVLTVKDLANQADDAWVVLQGKLVKQINAERYEFQDSTGTINVEIDQELWQDLTVNEHDSVEISGEFDKEWTEQEIDVKRIKKI